MEAYSVLMSVYHKADPDFFSESIRSMMEQTIATDDFVLVCDGPVTDALEQIIAAYVKEYPGVFQIIRLAENVGIGAAANIGLKYCKHDLVAKMDADDIAVSDRCESQLGAFAKDSELKVLGGYIEEFDRDPEEPFSVRSVPESDADIRNYARRRQPFNNQTVMYRRSAVLGVGGYRDFRRGEDYDLYLRLLHAGNRAGNLKKIMVKVRVNSDAQGRRASWETLKGCARSRWYAFRIGYASFWDFLICVVGETVILVSPSWVQSFLYRRFLREKADVMLHN